MDVIIVGAGKAGSLHYRAYRKLARSGALDPGRIRFVDPRGRAGAELRELLNSNGVPERVATSREELAATREGEAIVDLCLPSQALAPALLEWWEAGYRRFVVEKPFLVPPELAEPIAKVLAGAQVVLVRNYLHSRVHRTVRHLVELHGLEPVLCVTDFSKDRGSDSRRGRGATGERLPTVYEVEIPHQLYIGADLVGEPVGLDHAEDLDPEEGARLGEGVVIGRGASGASFVHYSDLRHHSTVRRLDLVCRGGMSVHANYAPICEELTDIKAGVILAKDGRTIERRLFTDDDNMFGMISHAYAVLTSSDGGNVDVDEVLRASETILSAVEGTYGPGPVGQGGILQDWATDTFRLGLASGAGRAFLSFLERRHRARLSDALPALDPAAVTAEGVLV